jgi:branched-chain amino acid transport system permease protein
MIFMVLIGGLGTFEGPVIGALIFFAIQQQFADQGSWYLIGLGLVAIGMTLLAPRGIWGTIIDRYDLQLVPVGYRLRGLPPHRVPGASDHEAAAGRAAQSASRSGSGPTDP